MKHEEIKKFNDQVSELISDRRMEQALAEMVEECQRSGRYELADRVATLQTDYYSMLDYYARGASDPARGEVFAHINHEAWTLLDTLIDSLERDTSRAYYYTQQRALAGRGQTLTGLAADFAGLCRAGATTGLDAVASNLFLAIWTNFPATAADRDALRSLLLDDAVPTMYRAVFLSAATLGLLTFFDAEKAEDLYTYTVGQPAEVTERAWVGLLLVALKYTYRIDHLPRLREQLKFVAENGADGDGRPHLFELQMLILQCLEAETAQHKLETEISPAIRRGLKEMQRRHQRTEGDGGASATVIRMDDVSENPEWESFLKKSKLHDKIADFMRMRMEGTDVMLEAFRAMRHLPFFGPMMHWLLPYDTSHESVRELTDADPSALTLARITAANSGMCNTDRYANFYAMTSMSADSRRSLVEQLKEGGIEPPGSAEAEPLDVARAYLHDLYRLYALAPHRREWDSPFADRELLDFSSSPWLAQLSAGKEARRMVATYLFDKQRWPEAVTALERLLEVEVSEETLQKLAYAANQPEVDDPITVREALVSCNNLYPDREWTLRYMASFYIAEEEYASAELILDHALSIYPDDIDLLNKYATSLMRQGRYKEAFEPLYKADLLKEGQVKTERNLAWCFFMTRGLEKAEHYIRAVTARRADRTRRKAETKSQAIGNDWLNAGHIALASGNIMLALERYRHCFDYGGWTLDDFEQAAIDDWQDVMEAGIADTDYSLAIETLRSESNLE